jgi:hypothetical protein
MVLEALHQRGPDRLDTSVNSVIVPEFTSKRSAIGRLGIHRAAAYRDGEQLSRHTNPNHNPNQLRFK